MAKPVDKTDEFFQEQFHRFDEMEAVEPQFKREDKRVWKKGTHEISPQ